MSFSFLKPQQKRHEEAMTGSWDLIRRNHEDVGQAATRLETQDSWPEIRDEEESQETGQQTRPRHPLNTFEKLPDEIQVQIMKYLDNESLYRLSQSAPHFLRLSFDDVFETDQSWRAFRHTLDGLSDGPRRRVLDGPREGLGNGGQGHPIEPMQYSRSDGFGTPPSAIQIEDTRAPPPHWNKPPKTTEGEDPESADEGETMLSFMARNQRS